MNNKFKKHAWAYSNWQDIKDGNKLLGRVRCDIELTKEAEGYTFFPKVNVERSEDCDCPSNQTSKVHFSQCKYF